MELRKEALKLKNWPEALNTSKIVALGNANIYEYRVGVTIGDHDNLRLIFWIEPKKEGQRLYKTFEWRKEMVTRVP